MKYDTVVIGSGITGLTSALALAMRGKKVAVIEKSTHIAPLLSRFKRGNVWCDPGFHYAGGLGKSEALSVIFQSLGIMDKLHPVSLAPDGFDRLYYEDKEVIIPFGFGNVKEALSTSFPGSVKAVEAYIGKIEQILAKTSFMSYGFKYNKLSDIPHVEDNFVTLSDFLRSVGAEQALIDTLGQYGACLYGVSHEEVSLYTHAVVMGTFYISAHTLARGGDEIVDAFRDRLNEEGVSVFCDTEAVNIETDSERSIKSVVTGDGGGVFECESCISTIHPWLLTEILPKKAVRPAFISRIRSMENTPAAFALYLELDDVPAKSRHTNLFKLGGSNDSTEGTSLLAVMSCDSGPHDNMKKSMCVLKKGNTVSGKQGFFAAFRNVQRNIATIKSWRRRRY